ncbi:MAG: autotransporter domain-containing protein [Verrucomicrobia bacterium]|nr:autotransporter domain-containing protein [Verrucomicrobiota bacterium]
MPLLNRSLLIAAATLSAVLASATPTDVHPSGNTANDTWINGVSGDGFTAVGRTNLGPGLMNAFKLVGNAYATLTPLGGHQNAVATAASADGSVVVGFSIDGSAFNQAVSWTGVNPTALDTINEYMFSEATAVSANGGTIVGWGFSNINFIEEAFFYRNNTLTNIGVAFGSPFVASKAVGVSADGAVIVGTRGDSFSTPTTLQGFIHTSGGVTAVDAPTGIAAFGTNGLTLTQLTGISGDGAVVIGFASSSLNSSPLGNEQAFKYVRAGSTYQALGTLTGGNWSIARAVNSDGSVIVGQADNALGDREAFVHQNGTMTGLGALETGGSSNATGVSADGTVIVGYASVGARTHAFVYANQTMLDETEWMRSLNGPGGLTAMANNLGNLALEGAHHRPLMSYDGMGKQTHVWATGDFGASSRQTDRRTSFGEVGASQAYGDTVIGVAVGTALQTQDLLFGGDAKITGQTFMAEIDTRLADKESILSLLVLRGEWDAQTARGYVTGGGNDISRGQTDLNTTTVRVRYDGPAQKFISNVTAAPFASFALTRVRTDAFAESGGSFPASFDAHTHTAKESRLGLLTKFVAGPATTLRLTAEWIHRFDDAGDALSGVNQTTSGAFSVAGLAPTKDQARFGLDVDHKLTADTLLNFSVHAAGYGQAHDVAGSLSLRRGF